MVYLLHMNSRFPLVGAIYSYIFSGIGVILLLVGFYFLSQASIKQFVLPKYYLEWEETRCDYFDQQFPPIDTSMVIDTAPVGQNTPVQSTEVTNEAAVKENERLKKQKDDCSSKLEEQRTVRRTTDFATAAIFILLGGATLFYHQKKLRE